MNARKVRDKVYDVVDGTAVLIIIHNPLRYSVVCFCNLGCIASCIIGVSVMEHCNNLTAVL